MYRKVVVGYDESDQAEDALALGCLLAGTVRAELTVGPPTTLANERHAACEARGAGPVPARFVSPVEGAR